jgi:hypothetical protein
MKDVKVNREQLEQKVQENRNAHRAVFEDAQKNYRDLVIEELDKMLADARSGRKIIRAVLLPEPEDHTEDYDRVLAMLDMSVDEVIELEEEDFKCYVLDQWGWQRSFASNTMRYSSGNSR